MNKNEFKSAYNKISLPDDVREKMKARLMEKLDGENTEKRDSALHFSDEELLQTTQEIKLSPRKRPSAARMAAIIGSAAAVIAVFAVGAGIFVNKQPPISSSSSQTESPDPNSDSWEEEDIDTSETVIDVDSIPEQMYHAKQCANGEWIFQTMDITTEPHSAPDKECQNLGSALTIKDTLGFKCFMMSFSMSAVVDQYIDIAQIEGLTYYGSYHSSTGLSVIFRSEDGTKQINCNVSLDPNEFIPIEVDGGYLTPQDEPQSRFAMGTWANFIDPECFDMASGGVTLKGDSYYTSVFSETFYGVTQYVRIDAKNVTMDEFMACIDDCSPAGLEKDNRAASFAVGEVPDTLPYDTDWGTLVLNGATVYLNYKTSGEEHGNVISKNDLGGEVSQYGYTLDDAADFAGLDVIRDMTIAAVVGSGSGEIRYAASYEGMAGTYGYGDAMGECLPGQGANMEMLPGDDKAAFDESRSFISNPASGDELYDGEYAQSFYTTDKIDYFSGKNRTGARYYIHYASDTTNEVVDISVLDDWDMRLGMMTLGRYPAQESDGFISGADGFGKLYAGYGKSVQGEDVYIAGFKTANGKYVLLDCYGVELNRFAEILSQLYTNDTPIAIKIKASDDPATAEFIATEMGEDIMANANRAAIAYMRNDKQVLSQIMSDPNFDTILSDGSKYTSDIEMTFSIPDSFDAATGGDGVYPVKYKVIVDGIDMAMYLDMGLRQSDSGWKVEYIDFQG